MVIILFNMDTAYIINQKVVELLRPPRAIIFSRCEDAPTYKACLDLVATEKPNGVQLLPSGICVVPSLFAYAMSLTDDDRFIFYYNDEN